MDVLSNQDWAVLATVTLFAILAFAWVFYSVVSRMLPDDSPEKTEAPSTYITLGGDDWPPQSEHNPGPMCGRCYYEVGDETALHPANCNEKPELLLGMPIGQYHCPDCGTMVMAGCIHPKLCGPCLRRQHPSFDLYTPPTS